MQGAVMMRGASAAAADGEDRTSRGLPRQRLRRTRNGCERCRAQHRKCDEDKPRCQRCGRAGAPCEYVTHVSFLDKNSQTLSDTAVSRPSDLETHEYPTVKFVFDDDSSTQKAPGRSSTFTASYHAGRLRGRQIDLGTAPGLQRQPEAGSHSFRQRDAQGLGEDESGTCDDVSHRSPLLDSYQGTVSWPLSGRSSLSRHEIGLLKYYSHHVAPWIDVYDQGQTFRHLVTRLAVDSPYVMEGILQLSAVSSGLPIELVGRRGVGALHLRAMSRPYGVESAVLDIRLTVAFVLVRTLLFVQAVPDTWEPSFYRGGHSFGIERSDYDDATRRQTLLNSLALVSRLDISPSKEIAYSLMNQTAPVTVSRPLHQILNRPEMREVEACQTRRILDASLYCLGLLADVMNLCLPVAEAEVDAAPPGVALSASAGAPRTDRWKMLLDELLAWKESLPLELQPLVEVESREAAFPTVVFASGAGISSNTLFHTAMLLLLSNRPQSVSLAGWHGKPGLNAAQLSPHWHARRVCGIALSSEPEHTHCWDPCTIAAFALVARRMSHPSQQNDIIACLGRIKTAGWHIDGLVQKLRDEWGPLG